jgi:PucR C-terminal helix-turn-helix domain
MSALCEPEPVAADPEPTTADIRRYIRMAVCSDNPNDFITTMVATLDREIAVLDADGAPLHWASSCPVTPWMLALAQRARLSDQAEADGWRVYALYRGSEYHGSLVVSVTVALTATQEQLLEIFRGLLADQLQRARLARLLAHERSAALGRRLAGASAIDPDAIHAEAIRAGVRIADHYYAALLLGSRGCVDDEVLLEINGIVCEYNDASFAVPYGSRALVLLLAQNEASVRVTDAHQTAEDVLAVIRRSTPSADARVIVAERSVDLQSISAQVRRLWELRLYPVLREPAQTGVVSAGNFALVQMLEHFDQERAQEFVAARLGALLGYDQAHGGGLAETLEASLDWPSREEASRFAYVHRNTFRRRLKRAHDLIGSELSDPDERLAVHLALKLRRVQDAKASAAPAMGAARSQAG